MKTINEIRNLVEMVTTTGQGMEMAMRRLEEIVWAKEMGADFAQKAIWYLSSKQ